MGTLVELTRIPEWGSNEDLQGRVQGVNQTEHRIAVYIYVGGWWTKPSFASPLTQINADSTWTCDITTGGYDQEATRIAAFLVPGTYTPVKASGVQSLPEELYQVSLDSAIVVRKYRRDISFSGFTDSLNGRHAAQLL
jgi:hypothetical protein